MIAFRDKYKSTLGKIIIVERKEIVEHPFGTPIWNWGYTYFMKKATIFTQSESRFRDSVKKGYLDIESEPLL